MKNQIIITSFLVHVCLGAMENETQQDVRKLTTWKQHDFCEHDKKPVALHCSSFDEALATNNALIIRSYIQMDQKLNLNECDQDGNTYLHKAIQKKLFVAAQVLIESGFANSNLSNNAGQTPQMLAFEHPGCALFKPPFIPS